MKYTLIEENGQYALILRGESMTQYAVVSGLDQKAGSWDWTCCYYDFGKFSAMSKAEALFKALDYYLMRTNETHIPWARMNEIATVLKDGLIEDGEEEAYRYMADVAELSDTEAEYFGLDMERYRDVEDNPTAPSSTGGNYSCSMESRANYRCRGYEASGHEAQHVLSKNTTNEGESIMRYLIKTNLHMKLGTNKLLTSSCGLRVGAVLADDATAQFSSAYGQQIAELSCADQPRLETNKGQDHNKICQPLNVEIPQPIREETC